MWSLLHGVLKAIIGNNSNSFLKYADPVQNNDQEKYSYKSAYKDMHEGTDLQDREPSAK